ncbi:MAG: tripartite tricarboxylate transporter substrate-binding protein, partial [Xanthobacteraceae bacterium]
MRRLGFVLAAVAAALIGSAAQAQDYPNRTIKVVVPFAAGGAVDVLARLVAAKVADQVGQTVIIENRPGAGGTLGAD